MNRYKSEWKMSIVLEFTVHVEKRVSIQKLKENGESCFECLQCKGCFQVLKVHFEHQNRQLCWSTLMEHFVLPNRRVTITRVKTFFFAKLSLPIRINWTCAKKGKNYSIFSSAVLSSPWLVKWIKTSTSFPFYAFWPTFMQNVFLSFQQRSPGHSRFWHRFCHNESITYRTGNDNQLKNLNPKQPEPAKNYGNAGQNTLKFMSTGDEYKRESGNWSEDNTFLREDPDMNMDATFPPGTDVPFYFSTFNDFEMGPQVENPAWQEEPYSFNNNSSLLEIFPTPPFVRSRFFVRRSTTVSGFSYKI